MKLHKRWSVHLYRLRNGKATKRFQDDFNEFGEHAFGIKEINSGIAENMFLLEKELTRNTVLDGYNSILGGGDSEERASASELRSKKLLENADFKSMVYDKISNSLTGRKLSKKSKDKISKSNRGKKRSEIVRKRISDRVSGSNNPNAGNYKLYLDKETGEKHTTRDLFDMFGKTKSGLRDMFIKNDPRVKNLVKL